MTYVGPLLHHPLTSPGLLTVLFTPRPLPMSSVTVLMRKLHGYQHETSPTHPNSTSYSTNDTLISQAPRIAEREFPTTCCIAARPPTSFFSLPFFLFFPLLSSFLIFFPSFFSVKCFLSFPFLLLKCFPSFPFLFSFRNVSPFLFIPFSIFPSS